jgi:hypothetical protein
LAAGMCAIATEKKHFVICYYCDVALESTSNLYLIFFFWSVAENYLEVHPNGLPNCGDSISLPESWINISTTKDHKSVVVLFRQRLSEPDSTSVLLLQCYTGMPPQLTKGLSELRMIRLLG